MLFDGWNTILRTIVVGALGYASLVALLRVSGKRTLSKMNAFDLVVTVALGSSLATILLSRQVSLATGVAGIALLIALQYAVAWLSVRSRLIRTIVKSEPRLLLWHGRCLEDALITERVTQEEVLSALRSQGIAELESVHAVVLETDGTFSVLSCAGDDGPTLRGVVGFRGQRS